MEPRATCLGPACQNLPGCAFPSPLLSASSTQTTPTLHSGPLLVPAISLLAVFATLVHSVRSA